jgi:DNA-binding protein H-NS
MTTLDKVQARIAKLKAQAEVIVKTQSSTVIAKIHDIMERHGLTTADIDAYLGGKKHGRKAGAKAARTEGAASAKFQDPKTGATWTGHGRAPAWITNVKDRTRFLIDATGVAPNAKAASKPTAAGKAAGKTTAKGKLPPKYRNPKSGETWSGHARPPAWIKDVKDRSKYLIASADEGTAEPKAAGAKKAPAKKATAKKATAQKVATKKVAAKRGTAKRGTATAKKVPAKKAAVKKTAAKKAAAKKVVVRKAAASAVTSAQAPAAVTETASAAASA